ncbi:tellurite resistance protein TerC [Xanthobacter flavus]|uniref:Membrane protein n=1 Tax=Xanthobacter flavus TaxID=281 RepID=A0A9W6CPB7_XANFL|nr:MULTISPECIES: TerC family protein [Xanthobacter]MBN8916592.1 TerC family protein [Hyphomicrobiales bacterium]MDR6333167.1 tellurite resistance protein TerC [Xanthobacter flavus]UDQ90271.1 TerC family protein [Xanthobacter autotrophicus]GLI21443.1 membrane protein [Xanthobacter flavus]
MDQLIALLFLDVAGKPLWLWLGFLAIVFALLAFDLGVLHRDSREIGIAESLRLSVFYIAVAAVFGGWIWASMGPQAGMQYFTGYAIEKALSIDNVFVISLIFSYFAIPRAYQYRALVWGIIAVLVLRGLMIGVGAALVQSYDWVLLLFGAFLVVTGIKMLFASEGETDISQNAALRFLTKRMRVTQELHGERFFVRQPHPVTGKAVLWATPLFLALVVINIADFVFAVDSVPAIFAITTDTYIVFTANIMAILGLRALYFALAAMVHRFSHLKYALAGVLVFIGGKIFWSHFFGKVDPAISLGVTVAMIAAGILFSLWRTGGGTDVKHAA